MPQSFEPYQKKLFSPSFYDLYQPLKKILQRTPVLESRGDRPLKMNFEDQLKALIFFHLEEHVSARHLIQVINEDDFARENIAPKNGIGKSTMLRILSGELKMNLGQFDDNAPNDDDIINFFKGSELQQYFIDMKNNKVKIIHKPQKHKDEEIESWGLKNS